MNDVYGLLLRYEIIKNMSDDEKRMLISLSSKDQHLMEIKRQLDAIQRQAEANKYSFRTDLLANITGNVITDSAIYIISQLFKHIRP